MGVSEVSFTENPIDAILYDMLNQLGCSYGLPMMIDLSDCDRLYPSIHDHPVDDDLQVVDTSKKPYLLNHWMLSLSIILGKVLRLLYSATGILYVTDQQLEDVQGELNG